MNGFLALNSIASVSGIVITMCWNRLVPFIGMDPDSYEWLMIEAGGNGFFCLCL